MDATDASQAACQKNEGKRVLFSEIRVLYFQREQGNQTVPREGGCSLGMNSTHFEEELVSVDEWEARSGPRRRYPVSTSSEELEVLDYRHRKKLLKRAGIKIISAEEGTECETLRNSRQSGGGCDCKDCNVDSCPCAMNGVVCQSEGEALGYPCSCTNDSCKNPEGRTEFYAQVVGIARQAVLRRQTVDEEPIEV